MNLNILFIPLIFGLATCWLYILTIAAPEVALETKVTLKFPTNFNDLITISTLLKLYYEKNWIYVLALFCSAYLYKQAFIIPGSALLNILGGALFGLKIALPLCCILTTIGATFCYLMSEKFGKQFIRKIWPNKIIYLQTKVDENSTRLFYFMLFLRMFPMTPNWLINLLSPVVNVPLRLFVLTVLIGLMPYNFLCVQAGDTLSSFTSLDEIFTSKTFVQLLIMASVALGPSVIFRKEIKHNKVSNN